MKKLLFLTALAAGLMTSCSDEVVMPMASEDGNAITFSTQAGVAMSRSAETLSSITKFTVDAVNADKSTYFSGIQFIYDNATGVFKSVPSYYWPVSSSLNFYAISDPGTVTHDANNVPKYSYVNWAGEKDLVAATVLAGEKRVPYPLTFQHILSQIYVSAEASDKSEDLSYKLVGLSMTTPSKGTYSFAAATAGFGSWEIDNSSTSTYAYDAALPRTFAQNGSFHSGSTYWNILPVKDGKITFNVEYQVFKNNTLIADFTGSKAKVCEVENPNLAEGKKYTYNFKLTRGTSDDLSFTTDLEDWTDGTTTDMEIPGGESGDELAVDLGLPSGIRWASMNVGATKPEEYGKFFQWGSTEGYYNGEGAAEHSTWETCLWGSSAPTITNLDAEHDAAHVIMGGNWRMPTTADFYELKDNTTNTWLTVNGVEGIQFTSNVNGKSIFVPATGRWYNGSYGGDNSHFHLWSSERWGTTEARCLDGFSGYVTVSYYYRFNGLPIRAVLPKD